MAPCGTNHSRYASSVSPALPTTTFAPERSNHRLIDLPKRKLAVAVTASTADVPSGRPVAAGGAGKGERGGGEEGRIRGGADSLKKKKKRRTESASDSTKYSL